MTTKKTVSEKALERAEAGKEENVVVAPVGLVSSFNLMGLSGFTDADEIMPTVRIVQPNSDEIDLVEGGRAELGTFYNKGTKTSPKKIEFIIFQAHSSKEVDAKTLNPYDQIKVLGLGVNPADGPFAYYVTKSAVWGPGGLKSFLYGLKSLKLSAIWDVVVEATSEKVSNKQGSWYVPRFRVVGKTTEEQRALARSVYDRFGTPISQDAKDEGEMAEPEEEVSGEEDINPEDVPDFALDEVK